MSFDYGQAVIDNEIALMLKHVRRGFGFSKDSASLAEIKQTGPAGMFAANPQTLERMTDATFMPELADRKLREQWRSEGGSTIHQRAMNKAFDILSRPNPGALDAAADARIRAEFAGLVAGDAALPEGWIRNAAGGVAIKRPRRINRRRRAS